jgi:hypothetical protein
MEAVEEVEEVEPLGSYRPSLRSSSVIVALRAHSKAGGYVLHPVDVPDIGPF